MTHRFDKIRLGFMAAILPLTLLFSSCAGPSVPAAKTSSTGTASSKAIKSSAVSSSAVSSNPASLPQPSSLPSTKNKHVICIDPGHQKRVDTSTEPIAPGATEKKMKNPGGTEGIKTKTPEYVVNLLVSKKIQALLVSKGYTVVMTRDSNDGDISNIGRANMANTANADIFLRIHADSADSASVHGVSVLIPKTGYLKDAKMISESKRIGTAVLNGIVGSTGAASRGLSPRGDMTGFNWSKVPVVLVEMGFMSNPQEDVRLCDDTYQNKIAEGIVSGIDRYFK